MEQKKIKESKITKKEKDNVIWYRVLPHHRSNINTITGEFEIVIEMPGVSKDQVSVKLSPELIACIGRREHTEYTLTEYFPYLAEVDTIKAEYNHGFFKINGKFKDRLEDAIEIKL